MINEITFYPKVFKDQTDHHGHSGVSHAWQGDGGVHLRIYE